MAKRPQFLGILMKHLYEPVVEILSFEHRIFLLQSLLHGILNNAVQLPALGLLVLYIYGGGDNHLVLLKHLDHILGDAQEGME